MMTTTFLTQISPDSNELITLQAINSFEQFSFECTKLVAYLHLLCYMIGLKSLYHFFIQSEVKPKPIVTHLLSFSYASGKQQVITLSFDWFTVCVLRD